MKEILEVNMNDDFECICGNTSHSAGFYPCDGDGEYVEPDLKWEGLYKCDSCDRMYKSI